MGLSEFLDHLTGATHTRKLFARLPVNRVVDGGETEGEFAPGECYFQLRLAEMFLMNQRSYWRGYIPMAVAHVDFIHDSGMRSVPVCIGNNQLKAVEPKITDQYVEYINTNILGPSPYHGGDFTLFIGLFRMQVVDLSRQLFDFLEKIIKVFDVTQLSSYLKIADAVGSGLSDLLGMGDNVQLQMGRRQVFSDRKDSQSRLAPGYLIYMNCSENEVPVSDLWVKDGLLYRGDGPANLEPYQAHDFCLIEIIRREQRNDYTTMPFHRDYRRAQAEVFKGNPGEADRMFLSVVQQIASSPDLTQPHRFDIIQLYSANFEKQVELYRKASGAIASAGRAHRGPRTTLDARDVLKKAARTASKQELTASAERALLDIGNHLDEVVGSRTPQSDLTDKDLNDQMIRLAKVSRSTEKNPIALVAALTADMLNSTG